MKPLTRNWLLGSLLGWALLAYGWFGEHTWALGAAALLLGVLALERMDNLKRDRSGGA